MSRKIIVIGGGAAGFFAAIAAAEHAEVKLVEKTAKLLSKVRISGGGRCNVTHHCFDPKQLTQNYPRGGRELLGPFHRFGPQDTIAWFEKHGIKIKAEDDGRMFPTTNRSQTIIDCLVDAAEKSGVEIQTQCRIKAIEKTPEGFRLVGPTDLSCDSLLLASGSSSQGHAFAKALGHSIVEPVPSLFTFNVPSSNLLDLSGITIPKARLRLENTKLEQTGPLLLTHWGFSGPAALKLSAWSARFLQKTSYKANLIIDWLPDRSEEELLHMFKKLNHLRSLHQTLNLPKKLLKRFAEILSIRQPSKKLVEKLKRDRYAVDGKTTNKEEFVTCGGITLSEVDFRTMQSKCCPNLYFAGEILDIDGVTGGFNFQNAWTTGWIAGQSM